MLCWMPSRIRCCRWLLLTPHPALDRAMPQRSRSAVSTAVSRRMSWGGAGMWPCNDAASGVVVGVKLYADFVHCCSLIAVQLRGMGFAKFYVREALKHCQPGDVAAALAILSCWAAANPAVRTDSEPAAVSPGAAAQSPRMAAAAETGPSSSQVTSVWYLKRNFSY
jgi:hypothetical protein